MFSCWKLSALQLREIYHEEKNIKDTFKVKVKFICSDWNGPIINFRRYLKRTQKQKHKKLKKESNRETIWRNKKTAKIGDQMNGEQQERVFAVTFLIFVESFNLSKTLWQGRAAGVPTMALAFAQSHPSFPYQVVANQVRQNQFALGQTMANIGQFALRGKFSFLFSVKIDLFGI